MIIDAHGHACGEYVTLEKMLRKLDENHINRVILFPGETGNEKIDSIPDGKNKEILYFSNVVGEFFGRFMKIEQRINFGNQYVYYLRQLRPDKIIQFYWLTPKYLDSLEPDYESMNFSGIKLHQCIKYFDIRSDFFQKTINFAEDQQLPIIIHLYGRKDALCLIDIVKNRRVKVIVSHLLFYKEFYQLWPSISDQIYFDVANYYFINPETIQTAISYFGSNKLIFGSDSKFGENCIEKTIAMINTLPVSEEEKQRILGKNIYNLLDLKE
jgi:uncharacterized protein